VGDLYNLKNPSRNSHALNRELIELFKKFKCPVYAIPGNHDLTADDLDTITAQPISVLFASGAVKNLRHEIIEKKGMKVSLVGIPFTKHFDLDKTKIPPKDDAVAQVCVMHLYAGPRAGNLFKERLYGYEELSVLGSDVYVIGHYHEDQGIEWIDKKCFINLGSISRGSLTEERLDHKPKFGLIKITETEITAESIPIVIRPPEEVFDLEKRDEEIKQGLDIQKFVEHLAAEVNSSGVQKTTVEDHLKKMDLEKEVVDMVLSLIQEASL
jgi:DNA repair exonuclease SbcCD nuclease subunit